MDPLDKAMRTLVLLGKLIDKSTCKGKGYVVAGFEPCKDGVAPVRQIVVTANALRDANVLRGREANAFVARHGWVIRRMVCGTESRPVIVKRS
jgi:hypothetical protein